MNQSETKIVVGGVEYDFPQSLTLGEAADAEAVAKDGGAAAITLAMVWIAMRRRNPSITLEKVRALDFESIDLKGVDADPPTSTLATASDAESESVAGAPV